MKIKHLFPIFSVLAIVACNQELKQDEPIVLDNLSNVELLPGNQRFQINASSAGLSNATAIEISVADLKFNAPVDHATPSFSYIAEGVPAGTQTVTIKAVGEKGAASEPDTYEVNVFDNSIAASYTAKEVSAEYNEDDNEMDITLTASEGITSVTLSYKDSKGNDKTDTIEGNATSAVLTDWLDECDLTATSLVKPYENAIDAVALTPVTIKLPKIVITPDKIIALSNTTWAVTDFASDIVGGQYSNKTGAIGLWDGAVYWSNEGYHSSDKDGVPHHISFDLGVKAKLAEATIYFRGDGDFRDWPPQRFQVWGHADLADGETTATIDVADSPTRDNTEFCNESKAKGWVLLCEYYPKQEELETDKKVTVTLDDTNSVRFFRYRIVEGWKEPHVGESMYGNATEVELKAWEKSIKNL